MLYQGPAFQIAELPGGILNLVFDLQGQSSNVLNTVALDDMKKALGIIREQKNIKGLLLTSNKDAFILGADITEFLGHFKKTESELRTWLLEVHATFNGLEDLPYPKVAAVQGFALGGGLEVALCMDFRVLGMKTQIGLPETKLGIIPGWGGTIRLPRLIGADHAIEWITTAKYYKAEEALKFGAVDAVVEDSTIRESALELLNRAIKGELNWEARAQQKKSPLRLDKTESAMSFTGSKAFVAAAAGPHYPAPVKAVESIEEGARLSREEAGKIEVEKFAGLTKTPTAECLVQVFLGDQYLKKVSKKITEGTSQPKCAAVLGAGIMGGGIAYTSASTGVPVIMKDIKTEQLDLGMGEATKLLSKLVETKKFTLEKMGKVLSGISPTLSYSDFKNCDYVVEAVVENEKIKKSVFAEVETQISDTAILASNTSTISISKLAQGLKRPQNFIGMHFFNPVHRMPLVEIIRGKESSQEAVARGVKYALQMGKTPIVVNDCPGFLVNRVLFPYFNGFLFLLEDGVDFQRIDKIMEKWGWPMGPAYLLDVVGIDTGHHASAIMAAEFPDRMGFKNKNALEVMYAEKRFGQKNGKGFFQYSPDKKGKPTKNVDPAVPALLKPLAKQTADVTDEDIILRMMLPMLIESARCLEEKIVESPVEVDMGLLMGLGFPPFRAGIFKWADMMGLAHLYEASKKFQSIGPLYEFTPKMAEMAKSNSKYHQGV